MKAYLATGDRCTVSGEWEVRGTISTLVYISKGEIMPDYCGKKVQWTLITPG